MSNPNPPEETRFTKENAAEMGAKGGRNKKGSKHLSTHIQEMLNDPDFELKLKNGEVLKGAPIAAIIKTAVAKSISGDTRAMEWMAKYGYGTKVDITTGGEKLNDTSDISDEELAKRIEMYLGKKQ